MQQLKNPRTIAAVTTALFVVSAGWLMTTRNVNSSLEAGWQEQKLRSEALLSEKLLLEKEIEKMKDQLFSLKGENLDLDNLAKSTGLKLKDQESEYNRMKKQNASLTQIRKQRAELEGLRNALENELQRLKVSYAELEARNMELNSEVADLQGRNKILSDDLQRSAFAAVDHSQIQAVRGKSQRLTLKGRRTHKLIATFQTSAELKNLSFRITDEKGTVLKQNDGTLAFTSSPSDLSFTASSASGASGSKLQDVKMVYIPKAKLRTGLYTIEVLNEGLYVGSLQMKLN